MRTQAAVDEVIDQMARLAKKNQELAPHEVIAAAEVVYGFWPDRTMRGGYSSMIIKGEEALATIVRTGKTRDCVMSAISCQHEGEAVGYRLLFGDGSAFSAEGRAN